MRADRLLSILLILQGHGRVTAAALAQRLEVSERTIYRDLDALSLAGVPVYAERGRNGGCVLRPGYRTDLTGLNDAEVASLFAGVAGKALDALGLGAGLRGALVKLEAALPQGRRIEVDRVRARLHIDAAAWFTPAEPTPHLATLRNAVFADRKIRLTHRRTDGAVTTRVVDPLGLVVKGGVRYLVAVSAGAFRVFRASRIHRVVSTKLTSERPARFDLAAFWQRWSRDFVRSIPEYWVKFRVAVPALPILEQVFGDRVWPAVEAARRPAASRRRALTIKFSFDSREAACGQLLRLGTLVEVLEPAELRGALRVTAEAVARLYAE
jgi:predicted DNA-binding transcriptional regulator YafY